jgi:hypothetical protein
MRNGAEGRVERTLMRCATPILIVSMLAMWPVTNSNAVASQRPGTVPFVNLIVQLHMISPQVGWALTTHGVARTEDGGHVWTAVGPPSFKSLDDGCSRYGPKWHLMQWGRRRPG